MKRTTADKLRHAYEVCTKHNKPTGFTIEFMMSYANVEHASVMNWLLSNVFAEV